MKLEDVQLIRGTNVNCVKFLFPFLVVHDESERERAAIFLEDLFVRFPENVFVSLAFNKHTDELLGFVAAFISIDTGVFVHQCWTQSRLVTRLLFHKVIIWGMSKDCPTISLQTHRNAEAMARITGMEVVSTVLGAKLNDAFEKQFEAKLTRELENEQGQQSTELHEDDVSDEVSTEGGGESGGLLQQDSSSAVGPADQELSEGERPSGDVSVQRSDE